jgi:molybdenum cofactor cytidylyltransferase
MAVGAVVLAAGASRRLGRPKQLVPFRGRPLLRAVVEQALGSRCDAVLVVLGANAEAIAFVLEGLAVDVVSNPEWHEGLAASIRCGIQAAERRAWRGALLLPCDQPGLTATHLDRLVEAHATGATLVASRYDGTLGVPALFDRRWFAALGALRGDEGAKHIIRRAADVAVVDFAAGAFDLDTEHDVARIAR